MRTTTTLRTLATLAVLAVLSAPHTTTPQTCANPAARNLLAGSLADGFLNPASLEDNQFFTTQSGYPNIFFVIDTSGSMARLPPNGPAFLTGSGMVDPTHLPATGVVGCGSTSEFGSLTSSKALDAVDARAYHSPCGDTPHDNLAYKGDQTVAGGVDYASAASVCPYYTPSDPFKTGDPGYDPEFFSSTTSDRAGSRPNYFPRDRVFHDTVFDGPVYDRTGAPRGNGWNFTNVYPWEVSNNTDGTIAEFCAAQGTTRQPALTGPTRAAICNACLTKKGWYYDGNIDARSQDQITDAKYPSLWYTGNYLNFFPPKFVIARRVVKDVIANQTKIRMALARFGSGGYTFVRDFNPSCQSVFGSGNWESNRTTYVNDVNALGWGGGTPLATSLFDVGRYYHTPTLTWFGGSWERNNDSNYESSDSANQLAVCWSCQSSSVIILTDGVPSTNDGNSLPPGTATLADANGKYAGDPSTGILGVSKTDCPKCAEFPATVDYKNNLTRVAWYLHNFDLRSEPAGACGGSGRTSDGRGMPGKQVLDVYTVGFATSQLQDATRILQNAASVGGGLFINADSADALRQGIFKVFKEINERATSFSVATVSTLQTTTGHSVVVPRFDPSREPHWAGHLYRFELYSEFVNACDGASSAVKCCEPGGEFDYDCDGACGSVFLQDADGDFVAEDGNGRFVKTGSRPHCDQTPLCVAKGKACGDFTDPPVTANPWWDAYEALKQQEWKQRSVWTVTDTDGDGDLDASDTMLRLEASDDVATALLPYLGLGTAGRACADIAGKIATAGDSLTAQLVASSKLECAKTIIRFVLGADVLNEAGRQSPEWPPPLANPTQPATLGNAALGILPNLPDQDLLLDRKFKLGDIYHSSPVVVDAPLPADGILCVNGLHNQCLDSLWTTAVKPDVSNTNPYDVYAKSVPYQNRRKMILVGANDGMLHAFNAGKWHAADYPGDPKGDDPNTPKEIIDESQPPFNGYYDRGEQEKVGGKAPIELWAFVPPDLLGKLHQLLVGEHQIFVDGTAMVRDVWVDGVANAIASSAADEDDLKSPSEFHTVAVVGERRGGTHYFALDLSDSAKLKDENGGSWVKPKFLWVYPQPNDAESLVIGETYTDFLPTPPPIGPVRIKADANSKVPSADTPLYGGVPYHEKWIALLSGGYDPQHLRGRGVHMVDVWTGKELFDFSYPTSGTPGADDPRRALTFPVAAVQGMVMWGISESRPSLGVENGGYFDTATFGDTGGQLWVLRFNAPGELDASGKVTNWHGGRIFQMGNGTGSFCNKRGGQPFFYITANAAMPRSHLYRVFAGTGDRFNLLDTEGGTCGPDNIRACAQRGCTVTLTTGTNTYAITGDGSDGRGLAQTACSGSSQSDFTPSVDLSGTAPACGARIDARIAVTGCPGSLSFTKDVAVTCSADADGDYGCQIGNTAARTAGAPNYAGSLSVTTTNWTTYPQSHNWFFALRVFDSTGARKIFSTAAEADAYDDARYRLEDSVTSPSTDAGTWTAIGGWKIIDGATTSAAAGADEYTEGWGIYYHHGPVVTTEGHTYNVNLLDERTSSPTGLYGKVLWNTIQPALDEATTTKAGCTQSKCTASFRRLSYHYGADPISGAAVLFDTAADGTQTARRSLAQNTLVPAQGDQPTVFVNRKGQFSVGLTAVNPEKGASNLGMGQATDPVMGLGVIEVSKELHECRHAGDAPPETDPVARAKFFADLAKKCRK